MEKMRPIFCRLVLLGFSFVPLAYAHHGYAAYDMTKTVTVTGTVVEMTMANPHSSLTFDVKDEKGNWTRDTLKPGDGVTISLHPAKNGAHVGVLVGKITYADGRPLSVKSTPNQ